MKDWTIRGSHYVLELPEGRELHIDTSSPHHTEGWFHRPGIEPLRVARCYSVEETKSILLQLAAELTRTRKMIDL